MTLEHRIEALGALGDYIIAWPDELEMISLRACNDNAWFTPETVQQSLLAVAKKYLDREALRSWVSKYSIPESSEKTIGLILAGNIPLVGFHDILSVFISGHHCMIKLSDKDKILLPWLIDQLVKTNADYRSRFTFAERLTDYQAIIATGSNTSANYFEKYFTHVPHIIRKNRNGIAILHHDIDDAVLKALGNDVFNYYGLGCRNVSKLYVQQGFDVKRLFNAFKDFADVKNHNKYMNNYDYNNALLLLNSEKFLTNDFLILKEDQEITSRIACLHYEYFTDEEDLSSLLLPQKESIQCTICDREINGFDVKEFGMAQSPSLEDYADGIDTMQFLTGL